MNVFKNTKFAQVILAAAAAATLAGTMADADSLMRVDKDTLSIIKKPVLGVGQSASDRLVLGSGNAAPIPYPNCPAEFTLKQRGSTIFRCVKTVHNAQVPFVVAQAEADSCNPSSYWNATPSVTTSPAHAYHMRVTYRCTKG